MNFLHKEFYNSSSTVGNGGRRRTSEGVYRKVIQKLNTFEKRLNIIRRSGMMIVEETRDHSKRVWVG